MLPHSEPQSRWARFILWFEEEIDRFKGALDPSAKTPSRSPSLLSVVVLVIALLALPALIVGAAIWAYDGHHWGLIVVVLKFSKLFGVGFCLVVAALFGGRLGRIPLLQRIQGRGAQGPKG